MRIALASTDDRKVIEEIDRRFYDMRSARGEGPPVPADPGAEEYVVASRGGDLVGFAGISGPHTASAYPIERFFRRDELPIAFDDGLFEVRILDLGTERAEEHPALSLAYAALRWIELRGGTHLVAIARIDLIPFFRKLGLVPLELRLHAGMVEFEVMHASLLVLRRRSAALSTELEMLQASLEWDLPFAFAPEAE